MKRRAGFTLIEILVALTVFGLVGGLLLQLFGAGLFSAGRAADQSHAALLARSKLTELQASPRPEPGILTGEFTDGYRWQATLSDAIAPDLPSLKSLVPLHVDLRVSWGPADAEQVFVVESLLVAQESSP